jgi:hypothetical protein
MVWRLILTPFLKRNGVLFYGDNGMGFLRRNEMKKIVLVLLAMAMLSGCVNKVWMIPEGRTQRDFERDKAQCMYEARIYTPPSSAYVPPAPRDRYGISGAIATGLAQGIEEGARIANLFGMCMRARGYYLVDKPQPIPVSDISPQDIAQKDQSR